MPGSCLFAGTLLQQFSSTEEVLFPDVVCQQNGAVLTVTTDYSGRWCLVRGVTLFWIRNLRIVATLDKISFGEKCFLCWSHRDKATFGLMCKSSLFRVHVCYPTVYTILIYVFLFVFKLNVQLSVLCCVCRRMKRLPRACLPYLCLFLSEVTNEALCHSRVLTNLTCLFAWPLSFPVLGSLVVSWLQLPISLHDRYKYVEPRCITIF